MDTKPHGLEVVPDRTTFGRWWRRYLTLLEETFVNMADMLQLIEPTQQIKPPSRGVTAVFSAPLWR
jgi:hypothetical protein